MSLIKIVPNLLCAFRIIVAVVSAFLLSRGYKSVAIVFVVLGAISDFFDGYIARKYDAGTKVGVLLDPLADKIFTNLILWNTWFRNADAILLSVSLVLTIRDVVLICGSLLVVGKKVPLNPIFISKVCTTVVFVYIAMCLLISPNLQYVKYVGILSIVLITLTSIAYLRRYINARRYYNNSKILDQ